MRFLLAATCLVLTVAIIAENTAGSAAQGTAKSGAPKYTIKDVMNKAHKGKDSLLTKVKGKTATDAEAKTLLEMYKALAKDKPPKGDDKSWKMKTDALIEGAKLYVDGKKDEGVTKLNAASNCQGCHSVHKGKA